MITQAKYDDSSDDERLSTINLSRGSTVETWEEEYTTTKCIFSDEKVRH